MHILMKVLHHLFQKLFVFLDCLKLKEKMFYVLEFEKKMFELLVFSPIFVIFLF